MKKIIKSVSLLTICAIIPGAMAATSRVGMVNKAASRLPSIAGYIKASNITTTATTTSSSSYYDNTECIDKYTDCIKADDACGSDMSDCTTNVLFHGQMSNCLSVLYQCQPSGVAALFGTSSIEALSSVASTNSENEVTRYTYPTDGSVLGQLIIGAGISNKFSTEQCVKSYTRCLQRGEVCGSDFELCTSPKEFKKQAVLCDSTLARCQSEGKIQLFGSVANADSLRPSGTDVRLATMIEQGAQLAALNAVKTCQKITDNCLVSACTTNPWRCVEGTSMGVISAADFVTGQNELTGSTSSTQNIGNMSQYNDNYLESLTGSDIRKMLKAQCLESVGANKYCHMTYREKAPSNKDLVDIDLQEDVFSLAYAARKDMVNTKIQEALKKFDTKAKDKCIETIKSCAMRSCGGGLGSVCYSEAGNGTTGVHVNGANTYGEIRAGCEAIVNADANCQYAATSASADGYMYAYTDATTFTTLFPEYTGTENDIIGAVGMLNSILATSYNDAAIENMKKQCQTVALSCVKSMCGKDYTNCYRNRTDIVSGSYDTGDGRLDRSMNKMGGVLDYNIVQGLCMNTVKTSSVCEEHLKIATAAWRRQQDSQSWGTNGSVREAWLGANTTTVDTGAASNSVVIACRSNSNLEGMDCSGTMEPVDGRCVGLMDEDGCVYDQPVTQGMSEYALTNGATTLFQTLLVDVEKEAQAKYNAKLTKEQNVCLSNNNGGIMGTTDTGSTFMWVKLKGSKVPKNYQMKGLTTSQFAASNDLYGSFCRVKVTVMSDDKDIQNELGKDATAYFAVGDPFTCGSWIDQKTLQKISDRVATRKLCEEGYGEWNADGSCNVDAKTAKEKRAWALGTILPLVGGTVGGFALTDALQKNGNALGGILGKKSESEVNKAVNSCIDHINKANSAYYSASLATSCSNFSTYYNTAISEANKARSYARQSLTNSSIPDVFVRHDDTFKCTDNGVSGSDSTFLNSLKDLQSACSDAKADEGDSSFGINAAGAGTLAIAATAAGWAITKNVLESKQENIKNEAAQQWMNEVGDHIQCYIGTEEAGSYGDPVLFEIN